MAKAKKNSPTITHIRFSHSRKGSSAGGWEGRRHTHTERNTCIDSDQPDLGSATLSSPGYTLEDFKADRCLSTWLPALPSFIKSCGVNIMKSDKIWQKYVNILYEGHYVHDVTHLLLSLTLTTHFYHVHRNMIYLPNLHDEGKGRKVRAAAHCVVFIRVRNPTALFWPMHRLSLFSSLSLLSLFFAVAFVFPVHTSHYSRFRYFLRNQEK